MISAAVLLGYLMAFISSNNPDKALFNFSDTKEAINALEQAIINNVEDKDKIADQNNDIGITHYNKHDYLEAKSCFQKALYYNPNFKEAAYNVGLCFAKEDQTDSAITYFSTATIIDPEYSDAYNEIGLIYLNRDSFELAHEYFTIVTDLDSTHKYAHLNKGVACYYLNDMNAALDAYAKSSAADPKYDIPIYNSGLIHFNNGMYAKALPFFERTLKVNPEHLNANYYHAKCNETMNNGLLAIEQYVVFLSIADSTHWAHKRASQSTELLMNLYKLNNE